MSTSNADKTLEFITLLQDRPPLWQKEHRDFMNRDVRQKLFEEIAELSGLSVEVCRKKLKTLKDKMREITNKLPKTRSGQPAFEKGENVVRWPFYAPMLFMKDQFVGREMHGSFHDATQYESMQEEEPDLTTLADTEDDNTSIESSATPVPEKTNQKQRQSRGMLKKARMDEEFLLLEKEKIANLKKVLAAEETSQRNDEWGMFCSSLACDLRKLKDPYLVMQVKADINKVVSDAVLKQLQRNDPQPSTSYSPQPIQFRPDHFMSSSYQASSQEHSQQEDQCTYQLLH